VGACLPVVCPPAPTYLKAQLVDAAPSKVVYPQTLQYTCDKGFSTDSPTAPGADVVHTQCLYTGATRRSPRASRSMTA
jgi:hypothetical protein